MSIELNGTTGITTPDIESTTSTLGPLTQALNLGSTGQIVFPATQNASANANTLDDYEEGTWTPVSVEGTTSSVEGAYVKIGRTVYVNARILFSGVPSASYANFSGLPFTATGPMTYYSGGGREDTGLGIGMVTQVNAGGANITLNHIDAVNFQTKGYSNFNFFCWYIAA